MGIVIRSIGHPGRDRELIQAAITLDPDFEYRGDVADFDALADAEIVIMNLDALCMSGRASLDRLLLPADAAVIVAASDLRLRQQFRTRSVAQVISPLSVTEVGDALALAKDAVLLKRLNGLATLLAAYTQEIEREAHPAYGNGNSRLPPWETIEWIETEGNYVKVHTTSGRVTIRMTMNEAERALQGTSIVRGHRLWMVNLDRTVSSAVDESGTLQLCLDNGVVLTTSRTHRLHVRQLITSRPQGPPLQMAAQ